MLFGICSAVVMLITLLLQEAVFGVLPLPWRLIPAAFVLALALMHRVSFELGAVFFLTSVVATVMAGLAPAVTILGALICVAAAYGLMARVFARRSLVAFTGLAFSTSLLYFLLRFGFISKVPGFFPWMYIFSATMTALLAVIVSLVLEWMMSGFGKRFVTKNETYEVATER